MDKKYVKIIGVTQSRGFDDLHQTGYERNQEISVVEKS